LPVAPGEAQRPEPPGDPALASAPVGAAGDQGAGPGQPAPELPPIDSLERDSDYTVFLQPGVDKAMQRLALRKLWGTDPVLANLDGLLEYGDDFGAPFRASEAVATLYRVGQGIGRLADTSDAESPDPAGSAHMCATAPAPTEPVQPVQPVAGQDRVLADQIPAEEPAGIARPAPSSRAT
jgi:hypothetical protein